MSQQKPAGHRRTGHRMSRLARFAPASMMRRLFSFYRLQLRLLWTWRPGRRALVLRVAVSYYPELEFLLDGKPVPFRETADHFTCIRCPAGSHVLTVKARLGWLRTVTLLISLASLPLVVVLILRRRPRPAVSGT